MFLTKYRWRLRSAFNVRTNRVYRTSFFVCKGNSSEKNPVNDFGDFIHKQGFSVFLPFISLVAHYFDFHVNFESSLFLRIDDYVRIDN